MYENTKVSQQMMPGKSWKVDARDLDNSHGLVSGIMESGTQGAIRTAPCEMPPVKRSLQALQDQLSNAEKLFGSLEERLGPVLSPVNRPTGKMPQKTAGIALADAILQRAASLAELNDRIAHVLDRLGI